MGEAKTLLLFYSLHTHLLWFKVFRIEKLGIIKLKASRGHRFHELWTLPWEMNVQSLIYKVQIESGHKPLAFMRDTKSVNEYPVLGLCQIVGVPRLYLYFFKPHMGGTLCAIFLGIRAFQAITAIGMEYRFSYCARAGLNINSYKLRSKCCIFVSLEKLKSLSISCGWSCFS